MDDTNTKVLCMVLLFVDTLLFGWPPYLLVKDGNQTPRVARIRKLVISYLTCFAGGVFFGACMLHLLAEGREEMEDYFNKANVNIDFPVFEAVVAGGFFTIALIEQIAHRLMKRSADDPHKSLDLKRESLHNEAVNGGHPSTPPKGMDNILYQTSTVPTVSGDSVSNGVAGVYQPRGMYGAVEVTNSQSTADENIICYKARDANGAPSCNMSGAVVSPSRQPNQAVEEKRDDQGVGHGHSKDSELVNVAVTIEANPLRAFLLLAALSFHTVFDGLAVGLQTKASNIWEMFAAICIHKSLVALCLGMQLFLVYKSRPVKAFFWVFVFSLISPIGVGLGMILTSGHMNMLAEGLVSWVLQAVATGTFIYVTFFEILWEELLEKRGLLRLCLVIVGFGGMAVAKYVDKG